jgi:hypothetical protein
VAEEVEEKFGQSWEAVIGRWWSGGGGFGWWTRELGQFATVSRKKKGHGRRSCHRRGAEEVAVAVCHTCFSKENQVQTYMHARIKFHAYSDI